MGVARRITRDEWAALAAAGLSQAEASRKLGVSREAARQAAARLGIVFRDGRADPGPKGPPERRRASAPKPAGPALDAPLDPAPDRRCAAPGCGCFLSRYNPGPLCAPCDARAARRSAGLRP